MVYRWFSPANALDATTEVGAIGAIVTRRHDRHGKTAYLSTSQAEKVVTY